MKGGYKKGNACKSIQSISEKQEVIILVVYIRVTCCSMVCAYIFSLCITWCVLTPGGLRGAWCCRVPGRVCSPPRPTTPSSPSLSPVWFSTPWERPTSASWWTSTVSHTMLVAPCSVACGPLRSPRSGVGGIKHTIVVFSLSSERPLAFSPTALLLRHNKEHLSLCFCVCSRPNPVGGAAAKNGRC